MFNFKLLHALLILSNFLFVNITFARPILFPQEVKTKLAVLKITYDAFTNEEKEMVNQAFYENLAKDKRMMVMTAAEAREKLIPIGIDPSEMTDEAGYIRAGQVLNVDYVLVGNMDKIGNFVEMTFRLFTMPRGTQKRYPGGKTLDMLVKEEIPNIINLIYRDMGLKEEPETGKIELPSPEKQPALESGIKPHKKPPWALIAIGGAASGVVAAILLSSGGNGEGEQTKALPRPPIVQ